MSTQMPSSKKSAGIQGPRPNPLKLTKDPYKTKKSVPAPPTVYYEHTPKIIHTSPQEFRGVVQQLTGRSATPDSSKDFNSNRDELRGREEREGGNGIDDSMLLLTLGRHQNGEKGPLSVSDSPSFVFDSSSIVRSSVDQEF
ncbi:hypothetical protein LUZ60_005177 [Juncus effusus]|nr:hypothetical protein LUZ60_005177 [Juncus effusus]